MDRAVKPLRVLVLVHPDLIPPESSKGFSEQEINAWKTEYDVVSTLRKTGHEVRPLGVVVPRDEEDVQAVVRYAAERPGLVRYVRALR